MSTMEYLVTGWRAARAQARTRRMKRAGTRTRGRLVAAVADHGLTLAALTCFTTAAALIAIPLGLVVAGLGFLVLELRVSDQ